MRVVGIDVDSMAVTKFLLLIIQLPEIYSCKIAQVLTEWQYDSAREKSWSSIHTLNTHTVLSFSLPDALWDPTDLIWRKGIPFEAITGRTAPFI